MKDNEIKAVIAKYLRLRAKSNLDLLKYTGIKQATFYRRMSHPSEFKVAELRMIFDYLKVPQAERLI